VTNRGLLLSILLIASAVGTVRVSIAQPVDAPKPGEVFRDCPDCAEMVVVPHGDFEMGGGDTPYEKPQHKVTIAHPFAIGRGEVTFDEWDLCYSAGGCRHRPDDHGWGRGKRPVIDVSWDDAKVFLAWLSRSAGKNYRLPSEAEWEYAAAGGSEQREYAWGSMDPGTGTDYAIYDCNYALFCANYGIAPVGTAGMGAGRWGQLDMAGEVFEWNMDWFLNPYADPCTDCAYLGSSGAGRGLRGGGSAMGSWLYPYRHLDPPDDFDTPDTRGDDTGFRCARSP